MTREKYEKAEDLVKDIDNINLILETMEHNHWVGFVCADSPLETINSQTVTFREDLENFLRCERTKLMDEFDKL